MDWRRSDQVDEAVEIHMIVFAVQVVDDDGPFMGLLSVDHLQDGDLRQVGEPFLCAYSSCRRAVLPNRVRGTVSEARWKRFFQACTL